MKIRNKQGVALISVLLILTIMMSLTLGFVWHTMQDHFTSIAHQHSNACTYLAQAGVEYAMYLMKHNMMVFPSAPYSDNIRSDNPASVPPVPEYQQDEPYQGSAANARYTWVGRSEMLGAGTNGATASLSSWGNGTNPNNYDDAGTTNLIDATEVYPVSFQRLPLDHKCFAGDTTNYRPGQIINLFKEKDNSGNDVPREFLLISKLTLSNDTNVGIELGDSYACGTFKIGVSPPPDGSGDKYYFITSTGLVKKVPSNLLAPGASDPDTSTWDISDEAKFVPVSRRTIFCKVPYYQVYFNKTYGYWPKYENNLLNMEYVISPDNWFYKFK